MARPACLVRTVVKLTENVLDEPQLDSVKLGDGGYADRVYIGLIALREATTDTYAELIDRVAATPCLQAALEIDDELAGPPATSTVCEAANRQIATFCRTMLAIAMTEFSLSGVCAIHASGFDRSATSRRFEKWSDYTIRLSMTTLLVDFESLANFLGVGMVSESYVPPPLIRKRRAIVRGLKKFIEKRTDSKNEIHACSNSKESLTTGRYGMNRA